MFLGVHAVTAPDRPAVILAGSGRILTYAELDDTSARLASALHGLGLREGDVVALLSDNTAEAFEVFWGALRSGLYVTAINWQLSPDEVENILSESGAQALFVSAGVHGLAAAAAEVPDLALRYAFGGGVAGYGSYVDLLAGAGPRLTAQPRGSKLLYSSGTTGRPKGIKPHRQPIQVDEPGDAVTALLQHAFKATSEDVYLSPAPLYHAAPLRWSAAVHALGGTVVLMERFDAEAALAAIERYSATVTQMVPTMFVWMLQLPESTRTDHDVSSLRLAVHAGAPCPPDVKDAMIDWWGPVLVEYYESTEGHGVSIITAQEAKTKRGSVGKAALGVVHICDDDGAELRAAELPAGEVGWVYFERDVPAFTYYNDLEKTADARHPAHETWSTVGDLGYVDEESYLFLIDRKSFVIISGGVNVHPQEVENVLAMHPQIFDVAVIGIAHPEMGVQVEAVVTLRDGVEPSDKLAADLITYVRNRVAHFKAPRSVDFIDELPRSATGKLVKRTLQARYVEAKA